MHELAWVVGVSLKSITPGCRRKCDRLSQSDFELEVPVVTPGVCRCVCGRGVCWFVCFVPPWWFTMSLLLRASACQLTFSGCACSCSTSVCDATAGLSRLLLCALVLVFAVVNARETCPL